MWGVVFVVISCCLFIHLGMGETISRLLHVQFVLLHCVKCLTFWCVLGYSLLCLTLPIEGSICMAFLSAYIALWIDLVLAKLAEKYEEFYKSVGTEAESVH